MNTPRPLSESRKRALKVLLENPTISEREAAKLAGVSRGTIRIVRIEYAFDQFPASPFIIGADGKTTERRRRQYTKLRDGKRRLLRAVVPSRIWSKLYSVANAIAALPSEKERHLAITALRRLVKEAIERNRNPPVSLDQLATEIVQAHNASRLASRR
jgi:hypothetical protein